MLFLQNVIVENKIELNWAASMNRMIVLRGNDRITRSFSAIAKTKCQESAPLKSL